MKEVQQSRRGNQNHHIRKSKKSLRMKKRVGIALIILLISLIIYSGFLLFYNVKECEKENMACFIEALKTCDKVSFIREDSQAEWLYIIKGSQGNECEIEVRLKEVKQGTIEGEKLQNKKMTCLIEKRSTFFPEKDISKCSGPLKEELQDIIIKRMHSYLLENIGQVTEEFEGL